MTDPCFVCRHMALFLACVLVLSRLLSSPTCYPYLVFIAWLVSPAVVICSPYIIPLCLLSCAGSLCVYPHGNNCFLVIIILFLWSLCLSLSLVLLVFCFACAVFTPSWGFIFPFCSINLVCQQTVCDWVCSWKLMTNSLQMERKWLIFKTKKPFYREDSADSLQTKRERNPNHSGTF